MPVFFNGDISPENIKDLSGTGDVRNSLAPDGIRPMEYMIDNYINILQERRKYFTAEEPDPIGVYFNMLKLESRCTVVRGNHDTWLAEYIRNYFNTPEKKRKRLAPYPYNSFSIFSEHFTEVDMLDYIAGASLYEVIERGQERS